MNELRGRRRVGENSRQLSETAMSKMKMELKGKKSDEDRQLEEEAVKGCRMWPVERREIVLKCRAD
jgi:hypothetical protein